MLVDERAAYVLGIGKKIVFESLFQRCFLRLTHSLRLSSHWHCGVRVNMKHCTPGARRPYLQGFKIVSQTWRY